MAHANVCHFYKIISYTIVARAKSRTLLNKKSGIISRKKYYWKNCKCDGSNNDDIVLPLSLQSDDVDSVLNLLGSHLPEAQKQEAFQRHSQLYKMLKETNIL